MFVTRREWLSPSHSIRLPPRRRAIAETTSSPVPVPPRRRGFLRRFEQVPHPQRDAIERLQAKAPAEGEKVH
jgi:hypothetical protein